jgi:hypothetical protein
MNFEVRIDLTADMGTLRELRCSGPGVTVEEIVEEYVDSLVAYRDGITVQVIDARALPRKDLLDERDGDVEGRRAFTQTIAWIISNASEEWICAGWDSGCEHDVWILVQGGASGWGDGVVDEKMIATLRYLSDLIGGWVHWVEDVGVQFVAIDDWRAEHEVWKARR